MSSFIKVPYKAYTDTVMANVRWPNGAVTIELLDFYHHVVHFDVEVRGLSVRASTSLDNVEIWARDIELYKKNRPWAYGKDGE
jgi:hypothetical protein